MTGKMAGYYSNHSHKEQNEKHQGVTINSLNILPDSTQPFCMVKGDPSLYPQKRPNSLSVDVTRILQQSHHVVSNINGGWSVKKAGSLRALRNFSSKASAVKFGLMLSKKSCSELVIHRMDGTIEKKDRYLCEINEPRG